jgi:hypothetical protein
MAEPRTAAHTCHAEACEVHVPPKMLMCKTHWRMVPYGLRAAVWAAYQPGQERLDGTAFPTDEYLEVTRDAIEAVAEKEGRRRPGRCTDPDCDGDRGHTGKHFAWVPE